MSTLVRACSTLFFLTLLFSSTVNGQGLGARQEVNLDQVYQRYNLSGNGVVIAMIERGIDYRHPDFIDGQGNTRIAYLYDMIDTTGANDPDNPYGVGTIFTELDLNLSLRAGGEPPLSTDRFGHGTACTGIAAGDGSGTQDLAYQGVAPRATIISVKVTHDAFPAFSNQPGQEGVFNPDWIPIALDFVADKLEEMDMPGIALINLGSIGGPTDGTSAISRAMDDFVERGHILVCGVGDDGGQDNHAFGQVQQDSTIELTVDKVRAGNLRFDLWYSEEDRFELSVRKPDGSVLGPYEAPADANALNDQTFADISIFHRGANLDFFGATSNTREILIDLAGDVGEYDIILKGTSINTDGAFNATLNPSTFGTQNKFLNFVQAGSSINDYASSKRVIVPTDYVYDSTWVDVDGVSRGFIGQGSPGEIWLGSSAGPTFDGRTGVDIASPGEILVGAYSDNTYYENFRFNNVAAEEGQYGIQNAVSAAAPLLVGVIALVLEVNPTLGQEDIRRLISRTARTDEFTGANPDPTIWGAGKLDALAAVEEAFTAVNTREAVLPASTIRLFPNPVANQLQFQFNGLPSLPEQIMIQNQFGQIVRQEPNRSMQNGTIKLGDLPAGLYLFQLRGKDWIANRRFVKQ